jgi:YbbR domain-containing protein
VSAITRNWRLKLVAVFFACTTWSVVAYAGNPVKVLDVTAVPIQAGPPPNGWLMVSQLPAVTISVTGLQANLSNFKANSLHASLDLTKAHLGENLFHLRVDNTDPHVTVNQVAPASVDVILDQRDTVTKKVDVRLTNSPNNCCVAQNAKATSNPDMVRLTGPKSAVAKAQPFVVVDVTEARTDVQISLDVQLDGLDKKSAPLLTVEPKQVQATVPVTQVKKRATAVPHEVHTGSPAAGYQLVDVKVSPDTIIIEGDPGIIATISSIDTDPINIGNATGDVVQTVNLRPPAGVTIVGVSRVTVHYFISKNPAVQPTPTPSATPTA